MRLAANFRRRGTTKPALVAAAILAIGAAVGSAVAISPTVAPPIKWAGGVNIIQESVGPGAERLAYTVPAGVSFLLTDVVIVNEGTDPAFAQRISAGSAGSCVSATGRTTRLTVPPEDTLHLPLVTGVGFTAGQAVCLLNLDGDSETFWMLRGFLFTPAPA